MVPVILDLIKKFGGSKVPTEGERLKAGICGAGGMRTAEDGVKVILDTRKLLLEA